MENLLEEIAQLRKERDALNLDLSAATDMLNEMSAVMEAIATERDLLRQSQGLK